MSDLPLLKTMQGEEIERLKRRVAELEDMAINVCNAIRTVNNSERHKIMVSGDDQPCYWQRKEWVDWMLEVANELEKTSNEFK